MNLWGWVLEMDMNFGELWVGYNLELNTTQKLTDWNLYPHLMVPLGYDRKAIKKDFAGGGGSWVTSLRIALGSWPIPPLHKHLEVRCFALPCTSHTVFSSDTRAHRPKDQSLKPLHLSPSWHSLFWLKDHKSHPTAHQVSPALSGLLLSQG